MRANPEMEAGKSIKTATSFRENVTAIVDMAHISRQNGATIDEICHLTERGSSGSHHFSFRSFGRAGNEPEPTPRTRSTRSKLASNEALYRSG